MGTNDTGTVSTDEATTPPPEDTLSTDGVDENAPAGDTIERKPNTIEEAAEEEFPSLAGYPEVEIAERAGDVVEKESSVFARDHLILAVDYKGTDARAEIDKRNASNLVGDAIRQGLRVKGEAKRTSITKHPDKVSLLVRYEVEATPATLVQNSGIVEVPNGDTSNA